MAEKEAAAAVDEPTSTTQLEEPQTKRKTKSKKKHKRQPRNHVLVWNDDDHTFDYVIRMMKNLFGHPRERGMVIAQEVHEKGKAVCLTTTMEHAELKRDQIHAFGADAQATNRKG